MDAMGCIHNVSSNVLGGNGNISHHSFSGSNGGSCGSVISSSSGSMVWNLSTCFHCGLNKQTSNGQTSSFLSLNDLHSIWLQDCSPQCFFGFALFLSLLFPHHVDGNPCLCPCSLHQPHCGNIMDIILVNPHSSDIGIGVG